MARMTSHRRNWRHAATEAVPQRNEDRTRKLLATLADQSLVAAVPVAVVAIIAGIVSYGHIETLALSVHQPIGDARLLPFAVDFLIVAGSVIVLAGYWLGWLGVVVGVAGTLFANVESGLPYGRLAATVAAWPAIAFTVASFMLERWLKRQSGVPSEVTPEVTGEVTHEITPDITTEVFRDVTPEATDVSASWDAFRSEPVVSHEDTPPVATEEPAVVVPEVVPEVIPVVTEDIPPEITPPLPARRRRVVPAKASDDELVAIVLDATDDPASLTNYTVNKAIKAVCGDKGVGESRAARLVDLAQRRHRSRSVVAIGDRR